MIVNLMAADTAQILEKNLQNLPIRKQSQAKTALRCRSKFLDAERKFTKCKTRQKRLQPQFTKTVITLVVALLFAVITATSFALAAEAKATMAFIIGSIIGLIIGFIVGLTTDLILQKAQDHIDKKCECTEAEYNKAEEMLRKAEEELGQLEFLVSGC